MGSGELCGFVAGSPWWQETAGFQNMFDPHSFASPFYHLQMPPLERGWARKLCPPMH